MELVDESPCMLVVGALVFSVSIQAVAACLHEDVITLFVVTGIATGSVA